MSKLAILGATALSLTLAVAPAMAQHVRGSAGVRAAGTATGAQVGGTRISSGAAFRGAQASTSSVNVAGSRTTQFSQGGWRTGDRDGRFGRGAGFAAGLVVGSAFGAYGGYYDPYYYGDGYAYNDYYDGDYDSGYVVQPSVVVSSGGDASYCAQRYRSYDPASGTYLGFDGLRHPCL